jgi:hypothetical protein
MNENRLPDYLDRTQQAARDACGFVEGLAKEDFPGKSEPSRPSS